MCNKQYRRESNYLGMPAAGMERELMLPTALFLSIIYDFELSSLTKIL